MAKDKRQDSQNQGLSEFLGDRTRPSSWDDYLAAVALRFNREYRRESLTLPPEVEAMPVYQEWKAGLLTNKVTSPFWDIAKPQKNQRCLDLGCGVSFLIYPWREWEAFFYGQDISVTAQEILNARGPQLNSKLFKGVRLGAAHDLPYEVDQFDLVIATGFSCYYPLAYWADVMTAVKRVLKSDGVFVFDVLNPDSPLAENWAILETYLGAEAFLEPLNQWQRLIQAAQSQVLKKVEGELFQLYKIKFNR
jgi:SAM-dependent methyltransferase